MASIADMSSTWMEQKPNRNDNRFLREDKSMKNMMIVCVAAVAILGCGAYAYEPEVLPSFAKDGAVTWLCYSEGGAMRSEMDYAVVVDLEGHALGMFKRSKILTRAM